MKKFLKVLVLIPCLMFLVNCSKSSNNKLGSNQCYTQAQYGQTYYNPNCQNYGNGGGGYTQTQQCYGWYTYQGYQVYCQGYNCSGYVLQNQSGQSVRCQ